MKLIPPQQRSFQLMMIITEQRNHCYWCGQRLKNCEVCHGKGEYKENTCHPCKGSGKICPTHEADWD